jgi:hypothetical protein
LALALGFFLGTFFGGEKLLRALGFFLCLSILAGAGLWCWYLSLGLRDGETWWRGFAVCDCDCDCDGCWLGLGDWGFSAWGDSSLGFAGADWRSTGHNVKCFLGQAEEDIPDSDCCQQEDDL